MLRDYFSLAVESLRVRQVRTWLTMIGIFIGIAAIVSLISLGQGMKEAITSQFAALGSDKITIQARGLTLGPPGSNVVEPLSKSDLEAVKKVPGVNRAGGRMIKAVNVLFKEQRSFVFMADIPSDYQERALVLEVVKPTVEDGRFLNKGDKYKIVVGNDYAKKNIIGKGIVVGDKLEINGYQFEVVGVMEKKGLPMIDLAFIANEDAFREITGNIDEESLIVAEVNKGAAMKAVADDIKKTLRKHRNEEKDKEGFTVSTPDQFLNTLNTILSIVQAVLVGIAGISLMVGGIGIMNTMYTAVLERTKEIGVMKAIGAKNSDILLIFLIESGFLGLVGGTIGIMLGLGLSKMVELIAVYVWGNLLLKANFSPILIAGALAFSFIVGMVSGTLPAMQASKLQPVEALRSK
ncbi:ABC transporter permease [Candidatus Woesearchaeota archaeon]|nr:ABC transporter permease [Candidatus Woesearchaeota archaeon]